MIELFILYGLCTKVVGKAYERKRKATPFVLMTIAFWFLFEILFIITAMMVLPVFFSFFRSNPQNSAYLGFIGGFVGGWIAFLIVKNCTIGTYEAPAKYAGLIGTAPPPDSTELYAPCKILLVRDKSFVGCAVACKLYFNGEEVKLRNGQEVMLSTTKAQNVLDFKRSFGALNPTKPLYFTVEPGQQAEIHINVTQFVKYRGITVL